MIKHEIFLSPLAERKLEILLDYISKEWGNSVRNKYTDNEMSVRLLQRFSDI